VDLFEGVLFRWHDSYRYAVAESSIRATMKLLSRLILFLIWSTACCAYDISQPPKPAPSSLLAHDNNAEGKRRRKPSGAVGRTFVIVTTVCSGAVGACIGSALVPQNLARQWLPVSAAGTLLLVAAAVEGHWVGHVQKWRHDQQQGERKRRRRIPEVSEVIEYSSSGEQPSSTIITRDNDRTTIGSTTKVETTAAVEVEPTGDIIYPIQAQPKHDVSSFATEEKASSASDSSNDWAVTSGRDASSSSVVTADAASPASNEDKSINGRVSSNGSNAESTRPKQSQTVKVGDRTPATKSLPPAKKSHRNLLLFWKKKKQEKDATDQKPPIPPWSEFAQKDNSRPYVEDYGDDDIGEGLGL
jgi:hypothetical protein